MKSTTLAFAAFISAVLAQAPTLTELIASQDDLSTLGGALAAVPELAEAVSGLKDITILAPTDAAFEALLAQEGSAVAAAIKAQNVEAIAALLSYHVLNGTYASTDFSDIPAFGASLLTNAATVDGYAVANTALGQNVGLVLNGENATLLSGELQSANVVEADITAIPGITIHKIDEVLTIPTNVSTTLSKLPQIGFSAALGALTAADLVSTVDTIEDLTIFVPNDAAFVAAASAFEGASIETLTSVLTYHAVAGAVVFSSDIANGTVKTVQGNELTLSVGTDGTVYVDNAKVVLPNIILSNGVAHIIDTVLNPAQEDVNPAPYESATPAFPSASAVGTEVPFTSGVPSATSTIEIPAVATTAQFVSPGGVNGTATSTPASGSSTPAPSASEFPGAAVKVKGALGGAVIGLGMALII